MILFACLSLVSILKIQDSSSPLRGLPLLVREVHHRPPVGGLHLVTECVLVLLSGALDEGDECNEAEEKEELVLVAPDGVHAVEGQGPREALIAHVEGAQEREVGHPTQIVRQVR